MYRDGLRYIAAGGNAMTLRYHLEQGMHLILSELDALAVPVQGKQREVLQRGATYDYGTAGFSQFLRHGIKWNLEKVRAELTFIRLC